MSGDPDHPLFTAGVTAPKTQNMHIVRAYKEGRIERRWFDYLLSDKHFRSSLPPSGFLPVYTQAFTTGMKLPAHPFVKDFYHHHGISPAQLALNFWYCFIGAWVLWSQRFDVDLSLDQFMYMYKLSHIAKCHGWFYLGGRRRSQPRLGKLIHRIPFSSHSWKPMFFLVRGPFDFHPEDRCPHR